MMDIKWLQTFIKAAAHENFRKASEELFLSQPAITKHIQRLEGCLHVELFSRNGKQVLITPAGMRFLPQAKKIVQAYKDGLDDLESWKNGVSQKITVAVAPQIAASVLPVKLRAFMDNFPGMEVKIKIISSFEIGEEINSGRADIGLSRIKAVQSNLLNEIVQQERVILVAAPNENLTEREALLKHTLITHNHPDYWDILLEEIKGFYPAVRTMTVNQIEITKKFILEKLGVSFLPVSSVIPECKSGQLVEVKLDRIIPPVSRTFVVTKVKTTEAQELLHFLQNSFSEENSIN